MRWNSVSSTDSASSVRLGVSGEHRPLRMPGGTVDTPSFKHVSAPQCHTWLGGPVGMVRDTNGNCNPTHVVDFYDYICAVTTRPTNVLPNRRRITHSRCTIHYRRQRWRHSPWRHVSATSSRSPHGACVVASSVFFGAPYRQSYRIADSRYYFAAVKTLWNFENTCTNEITLTVFQFRKVY